MTQPMTDPDLADLRNTLERGDVFEGKIRGWVRTEEDGPSYLEAIDINDVRALVARLDAAEERRDLAEDLLREVARESDVCVFEVGKWMSTEIKIATLAKCRSYLR